MRKVSILFIIIGLGLVIYGGFQYIETKQAQVASLAEAKELVAHHKSEISEDPIDVEAEAQAFFPETGDKVGVLNIPKLASEIAIVEGTHEDELAHGVGHYRGTAYPLQDDQIVLSGHRDTVFQRMGELTRGDLLVLELPYGEFSYEIVDLQIVDADDRTIIVPTAPDEVLTVTTCYPFTYVGHAPDRYIITALPVEKNNK